MNTTQKLSLLFVATAGIGLFSADAHAGICDVASRPLVNGFEIITMICQRGGLQSTIGGVGAAAGLNADGTPFKVLTAELRETKTNSGSVAQSSGLNSAGTAIAGCTIVDSTVGDGPREVSCNSAARWTGVITYAEN
jgi:hypothetical protein